ncbi:MAG: SDR family oxidoreductase [Planctomycetaceae bacterium]
MLLDQKKAVVCGVANSKSIAWGIAQKLKEHGAEVALTCVESARRRVVKLAGEIGIQHVISCDVGNDDDVERAFKDLGEAFGGELDILVHSIAYARLEDLGGEFLVVNRDGWRTALETSAYSFVSMSRAARPLLIAAGGGSIMTLTFAGGDQIVPSYNVMGVAKAALERSMAYLAYDLGPDQIRVNAISPGPIETMSSVVVDRFSDSLNTVRRTSPLLRCVTPEDVGDAAVYFGSDLSKMVTGMVFYVDSGCHAMAVGAGTHPRVTQAERAAELVAQQ